MEVFTGNGLDFYSHGKAKPSFGKTVKNWNAK